MRFRTDRRAFSDSGRIAPFLRDMYRRLLDEIEIRAWSRLLCVECGDGWVAEEAWRRVGRGEVYGVDRSPQMIKAASMLRAVPGAIEFQVWDGQRLPFADEVFDYAVACFALNRFAEPVRVLRELRRVLKSGGELYLLEPDRDAFAGLYRVWDRWVGLADRGHVRYYSSVEFSRMLEEGGFSRISVLHRFEKVARGGKLLATAMVVRGHAMRVE